MPKDTTLLDSPNAPTLDELKAHFQANDFTTEQSAFDLGHTTKGGATEAGIVSFEADQISQAIANAIDIAYRRMKQ